ncbi:hypothetical protein CEP52_015226 [Fusarium oligoseptatum]|uniref:Beta-lactamase-related domain-containing protein n=1 Tax=Fusarium oligoseptatum TaxID=2604345 RepID=A0A428SF64_9HYPO|nr:hypothetical protein CEP52_015226 [Fusarium oligoseptatum]
MTTSARDAGFDDEALSRLCKAIQDDIDDGRMFGASIIVARRGKIGLQKVFGTVTPDGRAACDDDIYLAMSVSKSFTATLVLRSIDQGRFTLDTKVVEILPDFAAGGKQNVTLRQLLNHTAGTFRGFLPPGISAENLGNLDQYYASVASMPIDYAVLGKILVATDPKERNFRTIAKEELFDPLGMEHSCFGLAEDHADRVPVCHTEKQTNASTPMTQNMLTKGCTNGNEIPAASAFCTIRDLFRFVETMRQRGTNGEYRLMSKALFDYACKNHTGSLSNASPRAFYGIGGGSTMWMVDPDRDLSVCFLSAGFIEGLHHLERLSKINDLALAACD